jgi:hypothetical protein
MTYAFTDEPQVEEMEEYLGDYWEDDQALEQFCLECCFGPEE